MALNSLGLGMVFRATDEASPVMQGVQNNLGRTKKAAEAANLSAKDMGKGFEKIGASAAIAGGAIGAGLGLAVSEAAKFQFGVAQVATEADAAKLPAAQIAKLAKEMAQTYGVDLDTQIRAAYQGVAAGADDAAKSMALLNGANRLAIAGATSQETAILGITKVLNNYGLSFDHATDVADAFFVAVKGGQTTVGELGEAVGQVASLSKNAGLSMEELIGALGTAATLGKDTASSAAAMKVALAGVAHPTADAAAEAAKLGIKFDSASLRSKGLVGFLKMITSSSKYTADSMNHLFGSVEGAAFMAQLASNNMSALNDMMGGMATKAGGSQKAFETMSATLRQAGSILTANFQVALVGVGDVLIPLVTQATRFTTMIIKGFLSLPDPVKKAFVAFAAVSSAVLLTVGAVAGLVGVLLTSELPAIALVAALGAMMQMMIPLVAVGGLVIAVVMGIKQAFEANVGGLRDTVLPTVAKIQLAWSALSQAFSQGGFSGAVRDELNKAENQGIKNFAINVYSWFSRIGNFFEGLKKGFISASDAAGPTFARLSLAIDKVGGAFLRLFGGKQDPNKASQAFDRFGESGSKVGSVIEKVAEVVASGLSHAMEFSASFMDTINVWSPTFSRVWDSVKQVCGAFGDLGDALGKVAEAFGVQNQNTASSGSGLASFIVMMAELLSICAKVAAYIVNVLADSFKILGFVIGGVKEYVLFLFKSIVDGLMLTVQYAAKAVDAVSGVFGKKAGAEKGLGDIGKYLSGQSGGLTGTSNTSQVAGSGLLAPIVNASSLALPQANAAGNGSPATTDIKGAASANAFTNGGASAEAIGTSIASAMKTAPPPNVMVQAPIFLDSEKIGEAMAGKSGTANARSNTPGPAPAG